MTLTSLPPQSDVSTLRGEAQFGGENLEAEQLAWLVAAGAVLWVRAATVYVSVREPVGADSRLSVVDTARSTRNAEDATSESDTRLGWFAQVYAILREDRTFRRFVAVRSSLLVSALSPPYVVAVSVRSGTNDLAGLGGFIIASGVAALLGGRIFGRLADRSSRRLMMSGAGAASAVILALAMVVSLPGFSGEAAFGSLLFIACYFLLTLLHTGVRIGRKTYVLDMAEGDRRTTYVAVSNSAMGVILLVAGGISSLLAAVDVLLALVFLAGLGLVGVIAGSRLPEVSRDRL